MKIYHVYSPTWIYGRVYSRRSYADDAIESDIRKHYKGNIKIERVPKTEDITWILVYSDKETCLNGISVATISSLTLLTLYVIIVSREEVIP